MALVCLVGGTDESIGEDLAVLGSWSCGRAKASCPRELWILMGGGPVGLEVEVVVSSLTLSHRPHGCLAGRSQLTTAFGVGPCVCDCGSIITIVVALSYGRSWKAC